MNQARLDADHASDQESGGGRRQLVCLLLIVVGLWLASGVLLHVFIDDAEDRARFGDMFGAPSSLFSGLALGGVIYAVLLQQRQLRLQRQDLGYQRRELQLTRLELRAQLKEMRKSRAAAERAASLPVALDLFREYRGAEVTAASLTIMQRLFLVPEESRPTCLDDLDFKTLTAATTLLRFFSNVELLLEADLADESLMFDFLGTDVAVAWKCLRSIVEHEAFRRDYQQHFGRLYERFLRIRNARLEAGELAE